MGVCCCISLCRRKIHSMVATPATVKVTILLFFFHPCISNQIARYSCLTPLPLFCESIRFHLSAVPIVSEISISYIDSIFVPISCNENKILNESKKIDQFNLVLYFMCSVYSLFARAFLADMGVIPTIYWEGENSSCVQWSE